MRYGADRPCKLKRSIIDAGADERLRWMRGVVSLNHGDGRGLFVADYRDVESS